MMLDEFVLSKLSKLFDVVSNPVRIKIIYALAEEESLSVTEISQKIDVPQNTLSAHLKILFEGAYLKKEQKWRKVYYSIREPKLKEILEIGTQILYNKWEGNWEKIAEARNKIKQTIILKGEE
ncbi:MAG: metalloregulator ArsR/SmtB family transcription factor [Candidatus Stygibacter australis]|nr:metalloregulator ArsR/SmtB family transcription factor [Candidatus Stygibacter australis]